jgi:signal peptidase II
MLFSMICIGIVVSLFAADTFIKKYFDSPEGEKERKYAGGKIVLNRLRNDGFAGGRLSGHRWLVGMVSLIITVVGACLLIASMGKHGNHISRIGLSFVLGGAFSNTYDRLKKKYVVDYVRFNIGKGKFSRLVFNISDFGIIIGAVICLIGSR